MNKKKSELIEELNKSNGNIQTLCILCVCMFILMCIAIYVENYQYTSFIDAAHSYDECSQKLNQCELVQSNSTNFCETTTTIPNNASIMERSDCVNSGVARTLIQLCGNPKAYNITSNPLFCTNETLTQGQQFIVACDKWITEN